MKGQRSFSITPEDKTFVQRLGKELGFFRADDWYRLKAKDIPSSKSSLFRILVRKFENSPAKLLNAVYPDHTWLMWKFEMVPKGFWDIQENQSQFMSWLGVQLGYKTMDDWYKITQKDIIEHGGSTILGRYKDSVTKMITLMYPDHEWLIWKFGMASKGFWDSESNRRKFVDWFGIQLGYSTMEDWYKLKVRDIQELGGGTLISMYNNSRSRFLGNIYPDHAWVSWRFEVESKGLWEVRENQVEFMDWLSGKLGFTDKGDWYRIQIKDILENGGSTLLDKYSYSPLKLIASIYPDYPWDESKGSWNFMDNQKQFLDWLNTQLRFKSMEDWYKINAKEILEKGGSTFLASYSHLPSKMIMSTYPEHPWIIWKFSRSGLEPKQRVEFVEWLRKELKIDDLEEWYRVSWQQISKKASPSLFKQYPLEKYLQEAYPEHQWDVQKIQMKNFGNNRSSQRMLAKILKEIFPESGGLF